MRILYNNYVDSSTITSFSENPNYTFDTALKDTRLSRVGRTVNDSSEWLVFDLGSALAVSYVAILAHNLTGSATVNLEANTSDSWGAPAFTTALTVTAGSPVIKNFTEETYRYWRLTFADAANPDTYLEFGRIYLGTYLQMPGMKPGQSISNNTNSVSTKSESGQIYGDKRLNFIGPIEIRFPYITDSQKGDIITFFNVVDVVEPFILLIWESDLTVQGPIYANLTENLQWKKIESTGGIIWGLSLKFEECF